MKATQKKGPWLLTVDPPREKRDQRAHWFALADDSISACGMMRRSYAYAAVVAGRTPDECERRSHITCASCRILYNRKHGKRPVQP